MLLDLFHFHHKGNKCDDYMSKLGKMQGEQAMRMMIPTNKILQLLKLNMQNIAYPRED